MTMNPKLLGKERSVKPTDFSATPISSEKHYPSLYLGLKDIPEAKDWEIGETYKVLLTLKMTGLSERSEGQGNADFEIHKIAVEK